MIATDGLSIKALKKEAFSGSHHGMRYYLVTSQDTLYAYIYPEPWSFEKTPEEKKEKKEFPYTQEGLTAAIDWLSQRYEDDRSHWLTLEKDKMKLLLEG